MHSLMKIEKLGISELLSKKENQYPLIKTMIAKVKKEKNYSSDEEVFRDLETFLPRLKMKLIKASITDTSSTTS